MEREGVMEGYSGVGSCGVVRWLNGSLVSFFSKLDIFRRSGRGNYRFRQDTDIWRVGESRPQTGFSKKCNRQAGDESPLSVHE